MKNSTVFFIVFLMFCNLFTITYAQDKPVSNIKGKVMDKDAGSPFEAASVYC
jgi:hypothetical protein